MKNKDKIAYDITKKVFDLFAFSISQQRVLSEAYVKRIVLGILEQAEKAEGKPE